MLEALGLRFDYGHQQVLRGVDLRIGRRESVAVLGPSGSGKSTLLHCLAGLLPPSGGEVVLEGDSLYGGSAEQLIVLRRRRFGFVFQHHLLIGDLPLVENVALPLMLDGVRRRDAVRRAMERLERLGLAGLAWRRPSQVSGGEGQRAAVARALVHDPQIIFADEPTGSLDSASAATVLESLLGGVAGGEASLVVVTHDAGVSRRCDRVVTVGDGVVAEAVRA